MSLLELACKVAQSSTIGTKGVRLVGSSAMAVDGINTVRFDSILPVNGLDCHVEADALLKAWRGVPEPIISIQGNRLSFKSAQRAKIRASLPLLDTSAFIVPADYTPAGTTIEPGNFYDAMMRIHPFLSIRSKETSARAYALPDYLYAFDGTFVARTAFDTKMFDEAWNQFRMDTSTIDLIDKIKLNPLNLVLSDNGICLNYVYGWVEFIRYAGALPGNLADLFQHKNPLAYEPIPPEVLEGLKYMASIAADTDEIIFGNGQVVLARGEQSTYVIEYDTPAFVMKAYGLDVLLKHADRFYFGKDQLHFKGPHIEGMWSGQRTATKVPIEAIAGVTA